MSLFLGAILFVGGLLVLVLGEAGVDISTAIQNAPNINDSDADQRLPGTYTGSLTFDKPASDPILMGDYGIVQRHVQTCAWIEIKKQKKKVDTTSYEKSWVNTVPDSGTFATRGYDNNDGQLKNTQTVGKRFKVSAFGLSEVTSFLSLESISPQAGQVLGAQLIEEQWAYFAADKNCHNEGGAMVGDQRVRFEVIRTGDLVTAFGTINKHRIGPSRGQLILARGPRDSLISALGKHPHEQRWRYRALGGILLWIALYLIISPVLKLVASLPIVGTMVTSTSSGVTMTMAFCVTAGIIFMGWGMTFFTRLFASLIE